VFLAVAPLFTCWAFRTTSLRHLRRATIVLMPRWERETAAVLLERHRLTFWPRCRHAVDFFAQPGIEQRDFSALSMVTGGGAATPQQHHDILKNDLRARLRRGLRHDGDGIVPVHEPGPQAQPRCLGVPTFGVDCEWSIRSLSEPVPQGEVGEIVAHGAQVMLGFTGTSRKRTPRASSSSTASAPGTGDLAQHRTKTATSSCETG